MAQRLVCPNVVNPGWCLQKAAVHAAGRRAGKHAAAQRHVYQKVVCPAAEGTLRGNGDGLLIKIVIRPFFPWIK